jgi:protein ImuB
MLWLALQFPQLPLDRLGPAAHEGPLALTAVDGSTPRIGVVNAAARAQGVRVGHTVAAALALCDVLRILPRDVRGEQETLRSLATVALGFSSHVGLHGEAGIVLEVEASQRLFDGLVPLSRAVLLACTTLGYSAQAAIAPTPSGARLLARQGERRIVRRTDTLENLVAGWPLELAEIPAATRVSLDGIGVRRFDALLRLPRAELARRFGRDLVHYLDGLFGRRAEPVEPFRPPEHFESGFELPYAIEHGQALAFPVSRLLRELGAWLLIRQQALLRAEIVLRHEDHPPSSVLLGLVRASGDVEHLIGLARAQIERLALPGPVSAMTLRALECGPLAGAARDLFASANEREDIGRAIERLSSRLGAGAVRRLLEHAEHRPERAASRPPANELALPETSRVRANGAGQPKGGRAVAAGAAVNDAAAAYAATAAPPADRPLFLLDPVQPLEWWLRQAGGATGFDGPERIESGWWDGAPVARDYFRIATTHGVRLWAYRERPPRDGWFVHGIFA